MILEPRVKEYFNSGRKKLVGVKPNSDYTLLLEYDNGEKRLYDVKPLDGVFAALKPAALRVARSSGFTPRSARATP